MFWRDNCRLDPRGGEADQLRPQAVGGRPDGTADGQGATLPEPGAKPNESGKANGAAA